MPTNDLKTSLTLFADLLAYVLILIKKETGLIIFLDN